MLERDLLRLQFDSSEARSTFCKAFAMHKNRSRHMAGMRFGTISDGKLLYIVRLDDQQDPQSSRSGG